MKTNKKGISLIVLAITIIVMIILAAAIVLSLTSNNMVDRAKEATSANDLANAKQLVMVAEAEWEMEGKVEPYDSLKEYAEAKLLEAGFNISGGKDSIEVGEDATVYVYPTIPAGFVASPYEGEEKITTGLVIYQTNSLSGVSKEDAQTTYNQYVWIPVEDMTTFELVDWNIEGQENRSLHKSYNAADAVETVEYMSMRESVAKYGGFYIGRYEAGTSSDRTSTSGETDILVQRNKSVYNFVKWNDAKPRCATLSSDTAVVHLIYGEEWDAALSFIAKTDEEYPTNSGANGNFTKKLLKTGSSDAYAKNNIFDMAGNVYEYSMEMFSPTSRYHRGAHYYASSDVGTAAATGLYGDPSGGVVAYYGFRPALYIK